MTSYIPAPETVLYQPVSLCWCSHCFEEPTVRCRHGLGECERCGTREGDAMHRTVGGVGVVGKLRTR